MLSAFGITNKDDIRFDVGIAGLNMRLYNITNGYELSIGAMYESPIKEFNLRTLMKLSDLFGTDEIDVDNFAEGGCESCDYGSNYGHTIQIKNPTKNVEELDELTKLDNLFKEVLK